MHGDCWYNPSMSRTWQAPEDCLIVAATSLFMLSTCGMLMCRWPEAHREAVLHERWRAQVHSQGGAHS